MLDLLDADGQPVLVPTPKGVQPLRIEAMLKLDDDQINPAVKPGTPLDAPFAINYTADPARPRSEVRVAPLSQRPHGQGLDTALHDARSRRRGRGRLS